MAYHAPQRSRVQGRAPQGARGLKSRQRPARTAGAGRAPQGARGLKSFPDGFVGAVQASRPARGAWIEINQKTRRCRDGRVAPRKGRVD